MKNINFLAGFHRSGSTLLTCLLNQNPNFYASHESDLVEALYRIESTYRSYPSYMANVMQDNYQNILNDMAQSFYKNENKLMIFDKSHFWTTPYNMNLAFMINKKPKILFTYRPILDILASFVQLARKNPSNWIDENMRKESFAPMLYLPIDDARCEWLMKHDGIIMQSVLGYWLIHKEPYKNMAHIVDYDSLCNSPQDEMNKIYDFLGIERYEHNFQNIEDKEPQNDEIYGVPELHLIRSSLSKSSTDYEGVLSEYTINKYKDTLTRMGF